MSNLLREQDYLRHIEEAIARIQRYLDGKTENDFLSDDLIQDAVIRNLEIIGEAVSKLGGRPEGSIQLYPMARNLRHAQSIDSRIFFGKSEYRVGYGQ